MDGHKRPMFCRYVVFMLSRVHREPSLTNQRWSERMTKHCIEQAEITM